MTIHTHLIFDLGPTTLMTGGNSSIARSTEASKTSFIGWWSYHNINKALKVGLWSIFAKPLGINHECSGHLVLYNTVW